ncbi:MAG: hypothetical protein WAL56_21070 [Candidatus Sulfotelmatobacter sp.]
MSPKARTVVKPLNRSTARLGRHLEKNLLAYTAAASAGLLSAALPAEAEIIYTPSNTPMAVAQTNQSIVFTPLDLNKDGVADFSFAMSSTLRFFSSTFVATTTHIKFLLKVVPGQPGNEVVQGQMAATASAVPAGVKIGPQEKFASGSPYMAIKSCNSDFCTRNSGAWQKVEYAYVGLKFSIDGEVHYGWARVKFPYPGLIGYGEPNYYPSIYGYAYESTPNQPIVAGQTGGTAPETTSSQPASLGLLSLGAPGTSFWRGRD